ncbi:MAG: hypothetical protein PHE66_12820, partial [Syntrophaceticus schinkii]|nr:hypothetical protein [Syntrophaceticus schinkii]
WSPPLYSAFTKKDKRILEDMQTVKHCHGFSLVKIHYFAYHVSHEAPIQINSLWLHPAFEQHDPLLGSADPFHHRECLGRSFHLSGYASGTLQART